MEDLSTQLVALLQIMVIDVVLAGDNAIVVGLAASRVDPEVRARVIFWGLAGAVVLRIIFAAVTAQLLAIVGLTFAGGILLLWVCWKMYREIRSGAVAHEEERPPARRWSRCLAGRCHQADVVLVGHHPDSHRRRLDVARQRAGRGRRRQGSHSGCWSWVSCSPSC